MKIRSNPDKEYFMEIIKKIRNNGGFCPCRLKKDETTKCMCEEFIKQIEKGEEGFCRCQAYKATKE